MAGHVPERRTKLISHSCRHRLEKCLRYGAGHMQIDWVLSRCFAPGRLSLAHMRETPIRKQARDSRTTHSSEGSYMPVVREPAQCSAYNVRRRSEAYITVLGDRDCALYAELNLLTGCCHVSVAPLCNGLALASGMIQACRSKELADLNSVKLVVIGTLPSFLRQLSNDSRLLTWAKPREYMLDPSSVRDETRGNAQVLQQPHPGPSRPLRLT